MAFISDQTNRRLGNKPPLIYFPQIIKERGEDALTSQAVPLDIELHKIESYRRFLEVRREALCNLVNEFIESARKR